MTSGTQSSEFILTAVSLVVVALLVYFDVDAAPFIDYAKIVVPGYAGARGLAKLGAGRGGSTPPTDPVPSGPVTFDDV